MSEHDIATDTENLKKLTIQDIIHGLDNITTLSGFLSDDESAIKRARYEYLANLTADDMVPEAQAVVRSLGWLPRNTNMWIRGDWTPELFMNSTHGWTDTARQEVVLLTRDIPLISWYVNYRAGREQYVNTPAHLLENQAKIIQSELNEAFTSIRDCNGNTLRDDVPDLFLTVAGFGAYYKASLTSDFVAMVRSNFTRIDTTLEDAELTLAKYIAKGIPCKIVATKAGTYPVLVTEETTIDGDVYPVGKFMKSYKFTDATYDHTDGFSPVIAVTITE